MPLPEPQVEEIKKLLSEGLDSHRIAEQLGAPFLSVVAIKAVQTRLKNQEDADEAAIIDDAFQQSFGLEKDMQQALRQNIQQLEYGLKISDGGKEKKVASGFIDYHGKG